MNKFITRGISKETGEFVFGYYFYSSTTGHHIISEKTHFLYDSINVKNGVTLDYEITQKPDRWSNEYDQEGNKIWERDILLNKYDEMLICCFGKTGFNSERTFSSNGAYLKKIYTPDFKGDSKFLGNMQFSKKPYYNVIGNAHFNKKLLNNKE